MLESSAQGDTLNSYLTRNKVIKIYHLWFIYSLIVASKHNLL